LTKIGYNSSITPAGLELDVDHQLEDLCAYVQVSGRIIKKVCSYQNGALVNIGLT
jgi:hypothetical protein